MLLAVRSTSCAAASENATRELVGSAMSNPSELVHGRDMASPRSCRYWPHGQDEGWAASHRGRSSVDFITIIVESNFQYRQGANHQERKCRVLKPLSSS